MELTTELLRETALFIRDYYNNHFNDKYSFHNYERTVNIVRTSDALAGRQQLDDRGLKINHLAAWFLELGYSRDYNDPQQASLVIAREYFKTTGAGDREMKQIEEAILSTRIPQQPVSVQSQVLCDASMYHLGTKGAFKQMESLRAERAAVEQKEFTDDEWLEQNARMIGDHFYFTAGARDLFQKRKEKLLSQFLKKIKEGKDLRIGTPAAGDNAGETAAIIDDIKLERGVETFFRITERRHMELSKNAHDKASLLISVNSIVISIVLSVLFTKLEDNKHLLLPTLFLVITCTTTIIFAILSTRPKIIDGNTKGTPAEVPPEMNILFFGDFSKLTLAEYKKEMKATYKNRTDLYDSITKDIYYQGIILGWKYRYIKISYNIFMYGFIITILSFIIAFGIHTSR